MSTIFPPRRSIHPSYTFLPLCLRPQPNLVKTNNDHLKGEHTLLSCLPLLIPLVIVQPNCLAKHDPLRRQLTCPPISLIWSTRPSGFHRPSRVAVQMSPNNLNPRMTAMQSARSLYLFVFMADPPMGRPVYDALAALAAMSSSNDPPVTPKKIPYVASRYAV